MTRKMTIVGIDAGGTFTDFVCIRFDQTGAQDNIDVSIHKTLSTPKSPDQAILQGIKDLGLEAELQAGTLEIIHGSTVATNAVLEGNTARTAFVTNYGFGDLLTLARQTRPKLYALEFPPQAVPVPPQLCLETGGRLSAKAEVLEPLSEKELSELVAKLTELQPEAVAINLLFSFLDESFEAQIEKAIKESGLSVLVSRSSAVLPIYKEYERGIATWLNASLGPVVKAYLSNLQRELKECSLQIMQSSGETITADKAAAAAVHLLLSGPAGGLTAIQYLGQQTNDHNLISFDMGGTSTDVALLEGDIAITTESSIGSYPIAVPTVDMHTIGAGGGSIAYIDSGGMLQVGPRSAGADPGPACYDLGGEHATVTDANVVLGRLVADVNLAGSLQLNAERAFAAVAKLADQIGLAVEETALGIVNIANEHMAKAIREISVNRGYDAKEFTLASFGGAGGLHVCALADAMQMNRAIVPARGGVLSALGMLVAARGRQFTRTISRKSDGITPQELEALFANVEALGKEEMVEEGLRWQDLDSKRSLELRYVGQSYTLNIPWQSLEHCVTEFHQLHKKRYGYALETPTEIVNLRVHVAAEKPQLSFPKFANNNTDCNNPGSTKVYGHADSAQLIQRTAMESEAVIEGPVIITEYSATTYVAPGWQVKMDDWGNLLLNKAVTEAERNQQ